jgi:hypothetical protein
MSMENASKALIIAGAILISILLISIGIILINSGKDITATGTSGMNSQKIQTFNSQFTSYEGAKKGSEIKNLANVVRSSNASDAEHQVVLSIDGATNAAGDAVTTLAGLTSSKTYEVTLEYAEANDEAEPADGTVVVNPATWSTEVGYVISVTISD